MTSYSVVKRWTEHKSQAYAGSSFHFHKAIRLYGHEDFYCEILEDKIATKREAELIETRYILKFDTFENGYNLTNGGPGEIRKRANPEKLKKYKKRKKTAEILQMINDEGKIISGSREELGNMIGKSRQNIARVFRGEHSHILGWRPIVKSDSIKKTQEK